MSDAVQLELLGVKAVTTPVGLTEEQRQRIRHAIVSTAASVAPVLGFAAMLITDPEVIDTLVVAIEKALHPSLELHSGIGAIVDRRR